MEEEQVIESTGERQTKRNRLRDDMADLPLGELLELKEKIGTKMCNKVLFGNSAEKNSNFAVFKRENVKRPAEMSSKFKIPVFREVFVEKRKEKRDPRFDEASGEFKTHHFKQRFDFLKSLQNEEKFKLKEMCAAEEDPEKQEQIKSLIRRINDKEKTEKLEEKKKAKLKLLKKANMERLKQGKREFFIKKSDLKRDLTDQHLKELEKSGKLEKYLKRKSKKESRKTTPFVNNS